MAGLRLTILVIWVLVLLTTPRVSDRAHVSNVAAVPTTDEGLYRSQLTDANFGMLGFQLFETRNGRKHWRVASKFGELRRRENYAFMKEVNADFFAERTGNIVTTTSDYGRSQIDRERIDLEGNVKIQSKKGYLFEMQKVAYEGEAHRFLSDDVVNMRGPNIEKPSMLLKGQGLLAYIDKEHFILNKDITSQRRMKSSQWVHINSDKGEFFTNEQRAIYRGSVKSALPKVKMTSDALEIMADPERETMDAKGNVVLKMKEREGRAERAFVELGTNRITLMGKAQLATKGNTIRGKTIHLYTDEDRIEVEGAEGKLKP